MKITAIKTFPLFTEVGNYLFVKVEIDEAICGVGEAVRMQWIRSIEEAALKYTQGSSFRPPAIGKRRDGALHAG